jgi:hypothetical protein
MESTDNLFQGYRSDLVEPDSVAQAVGSELDGSELKAGHGFAQDEKCGESDGRAVGRHARQAAKVGKGKGTNLFDERIELGELKAKPLESAGLDIFALEKTGVGVTGAAGKAGVGGTEWAANFF